MYGAGMHIFAVWHYSLDVAVSGFVELNPVMVAAVLGGTPGEVVKALEYLSRPDTQSRSREEDGRRMVKEGQFQYRIVNWDHYQRIRNERDRREYNRLKQKEFRERQKRAKQFVGDPKTNVESEAA